MTLIGWFFLHILVIWLIDGQMDGQWIDLVKLAILYAFMIWV